MQKIDSINEILRITKGESSFNASYALTTFKDTDFSIPIPTRSFIFGINLILSGTVTFTLNNKVYTASAGQVFVVIPGSFIHFEPFETNLTSLTLFFDYNFLSDSLHKGIGVSLLQFGLNPILQLSNLEFDRISSIMHTLKLCYFTNESHNQAAAKYLVLALLTDINHIHSQLYQNSGNSVSYTRATDITNQFLELVRYQYLTNRKISKYAKQLGITSKHLSESIKATTGRPAMYWINIMVVQEAQILLIHTSLSISAITDSLNFIDQSTFGKFFKRFTMVSPLFYRKTHRNELLKDKDMDSVF